MKTLVSIMVACVVAFVSITASASVTCYVANKKGQHWTFTAPSQAQAYSLAQGHCAANSYNFLNCNPVCVSNSSVPVRCVVANKRGQSWVFTAPSQSQAYAAAQAACVRNSFNPANCNPVCSPAY